MDPLIGQRTGTRWMPAARDSDFGLDPGRAAAAVRELEPDLVFLTSPNNPTGTALPPAAIEAVGAAAPGMVVVDEAYAEFARDPGQSALDLLPASERLVGPRPMSNPFPMSGPPLPPLPPPPP